MSRKGRFIEQVFSEDFCKPSTSSAGHREKAAGQEWWGCLAQGTGMAAETPAGPDGKRLWASAGSVLSQTQLEVTESPEGAIRSDKPGYCSS